MCGTETIKQSYDWWQVQADSFGWKKADSGFKFKQMRDCSNAEDLLCKSEWQRRHDKTVVWTTASVKQVLLDSKSKPAFEWTRKLGTKTASTQLLHSAATTHCTQCYQTPFHAHIWGWVTRLVACVRYRPEEVGHDAHLRYSHMTMVYMYAQHTDMRSEECNLWEQPIAKMLASGQIWSWNIGNWCISGVL